SAGADTHAAIAQRLDVFHQRVAVARLPGQTEKDQENRLSERSDMSHNDMLHAERTPVKQNEGMNQQFRTEQDSMGPIQVPADALYGAQTQRAVLNFPISGLRFGRPFLRALGIVKHAAALANQQLGTLPAPTAGAIAQACEQVIDGEHD